MINGGTLAPESSQSNLLGSIQSTLSENSIGSEFAGGAMTFEGHSTNIKDAFNSLTSQPEGSVPSNLQAALSGGIPIIPPSEYSTTGGAGASSNGSTNESNEEDPDLVKPYNPTDPVVVFDPTFKKPALVRDYTGEDSSAKLDPQGNNSMVNNLEYEGVKIPMIQLNNIALDYSKIMDFQMKFCDFLPTVELKVDDYDDIIKSSDIPGISNTMIVIMFSNVEGTSKKISLQFYITDCKVNNDGTIDYKANLDLSNNLVSKHNKQIGSGKINTYTMFEQIAKDNQLGFAATPNCSSVCDNRYRQMYRETYEEFVKDQLSFAGDGTENIFEAWIDPFGYIVLVNLAWLMTCDLNPMQLVTKSINGMNFADKENEEFKNTSKEILRQITNTNTYAANDNMHFSLYTTNVNNNDVFNKGTSSKYYYLVNPGDSNLIRDAEGSICELSMDGAYAQENYKVENIEFIGIEFNEDDDDDGSGVPTIVQKKNIENYRSQLYNKTITVKMPQANLMLERGTLILVDIEEHDDSAKKLLINESDSVLASEPAEDLVVKNETTEEQADARNTLLMSDGFNDMTNIALSGVYYIKEIVYKYSYGDPEISEELTLAKRGLRTNILNESTPMKSDYVKE